MVYRTVVMTCNPDKRATMIMALSKAIDAKPPGMLSMALSADSTDDDKLVVAQAWESMDAFTSFRAALPPEKAAFFADLLASQAESWHNEGLSLPR